MIGEGGAVAPGGSSDSGIPLASTDRLEGYLVQLSEDAARENGVYTHPGMGTHHAAHRVVRLAQQALRSSYYTNH